MGREARARVIREAAHAIAKGASDKGLLIEAGWLAMAASSYPNGMTADQRDQLRTAFFAGAQHLFGAIMGILDPGEEATEADLRRMDLINHELQAFLQEYKQRHGITDPDIGPEKQTAQ